MSLRGSTALWTARAKEAIFANNEDIDAKKIKSKYHNMRNSWKAAKIMQEQSGFGLKEDDCSSSVNGRSSGSLKIAKPAANPALSEVLNRKCRFFWRLDEIFGTRPNNNPIVTVDTLITPLELPSESQTPLPSDPFALGLDDWPESDLDQQENVRASREVVQVDEEPEPTPAPSTRARLKRKSSTSLRKNKGYGDGELQKLVELNRSDWAEREEKRLRIQADTQIEIARIQANNQEKLLDKQLEMQREDRALQRERDEKQLQMFQNIVASIVQVVNKPA